MRRLSIANDAVRTAKSKGSYKSLKQSIKHLNEVLQSVTTKRRTDDIERSQNDLGNNTLSVDEEIVINKYGKALRDVTKMRHL